ncbi:hypothetical protein LXA43DRAFT_233370 [Ganoderma leucocontextum]|nr:hypothetical protein LXA43DRAFT_233370 [Ganoderma leucocontextum]
MLGGWSRQTTCRGPSKLYLCSCARPIPSPSQTRCISWVRRPHRSSRRGSRRRTWCGESLTCGLRGVQIALIVASANRASAARTLRCTSFPTPFPPRSPPSGNSAGLQHFQPLLAVGGASVGVAKRSFGKGGTPHRRAFTGSFDRRSEEDVSMVCQSVLDAWSAETFLISSPGGARCGDDVRLVCGQEGKCRFPPPAARARVMLSVE